MFSFKLPCPTFNKMFVLILNKQTTVKYFKCGVTLATLLFLSHFCQSPSLDYIGEKNEDEVISHYSQLLTDTLLSNSNKLGRT